MEILSIEKTSKDLTTKMETLRNMTDKNEEMVVSPPADAINSDNKSVFFDSVHIKPQCTTGTAGNIQPIIVIGGYREQDEH